MEDGERFGGRPTYKPSFVFLDSRPAWVVYVIYQKFLAFMNKCVVDACFRKVDICFILKSSLILLLKIGTSSLKSHVCYIFLSCKLVLTLKARKEDYKNKIALIQPQVPLNGEGIRSLNYLELSRLQVT